MFWVKAVCGNSKGPAGQVTPVPLHVQVFSRPKGVCASCPPAAGCVHPRRVTLLSAVGPGP